MSANIYSIYGSGGYGGQMQYGQTGYSQPPMQAQYYVPPTSQAYGMSGLYPAMPQQNFQDSSSQMMSQMMTMMMSMLMVVMTLFLSKRKPSTEIPDDEEGEVPPPADPPKDPPKEPPKEPPPPPGVPITPGQPGTVTPGDQNKYDDLISAAATKYGVDKNLIKAVMRQESDFDPAAVSASGCKGLMQLNPGTASDMGYTGTPDGLHDPAVNIDLGVKYLKKMIDLRGGDINSALQAYNAGPNAPPDTTPAGQDHGSGLYAKLVLGWKADLDAGKKLDTTLGAKPTGM